MKKTLTIILSLLLAIALFAGCGSQPAAVSPSPEGGSGAEASPAPVEKETIRIATLKGPTTMGLVKLLEDAESGLLDYNVENTICGTADEIVTLTAAGDIDLAAVPANLAATLYNKTEGQIKALAINTLGVLNVIEVGGSISSIQDLKGKTVYSTGKGTTPEYALNEILLKNGIDPASDLTIEYKSEATEIAAYLTGESAVDGAVAVLPQPYATTVLIKNPEARIALDLTDEWEKSGIAGQLLTGVTFAAAKFADDNPELLDAFLSDYTTSVAWVNDNNEAAAELIAGLGIVADAAIAQKALPYCNLACIQGDEMKQALSGYLGVLFAQNPASVGGSLPGDDFYYNA